MIGANKSIELGALPRLRRFLRRPWLEKSHALGVRWRKWLPRVPFPIRLPFGSWWLVRPNYLGEMLFWHGRFVDEEAGFRFIERFLQPGMTVVDAGAHEGYYTLLTSKRVGRSGKVISFEPSPRERKALHWHLLINRCKNVSVQEFALGDRNEDAELHLVERDQNGLNSLRPPATTAKTVALRVRVTRLDDWLRDRNLARVDFVKLDVEGAELSVLKGACELLHRCPRPIIYAEVEDMRTLPWGYRAAEIVVDLDALEYEWFQPQPDGRLVPIGAERGDFQANLVAIPKERKDEVLSRTNLPC